MPDKVITGHRMKRLIKAIKGYIYTVTVENGAAVETYHGEGCAEITGYTSGDYQSDPELWFCMVHEGDREAVKNRQRQRSPERSSRRSSTASFIATAPFAGSRAPLC